MKLQLTCFKSYDVRGQLDIEINEDIFYRIGRAFALVLEAKKVVIGRDCRESSFKLAESLSRGLTEEGVDVLI